MEKLSSVIDSLKERLNNPFVFSFIVSWLTYNWPVTMAFVWFNKEDLNIIEFINSTATGCHNLFVPLAGALFWTFAVPYLSVGIRMFNAKITKISNDEVFKISKDSKVSFEHYFEVMHENTQKGKQLDEMIDKQNELRKQRDTANNKADDLEKKIKLKEAEVDNLIVEQENTKIRNADNLRETVQSLKAKNEIKVNEVSSEWALKIAGKQTEINSLNTKLIDLNKGYSETFDIKIIQGVWKNKSDNTEVIFASNTIHEKETTFELVSFYYVQSNRKLRFVGVRSIGQRNEYIYYELTFTKDNTELIGIRNGEEYNLIRQNIGLVAH